MVDTVTRVITPWAAFGGKCLAVMDDNQSSEQTHGGSKSSRISPKGGHESSRKSQGAIIPIRQEGGVPAATFEAR